MHSKPALLINYFSVGLFFLLFNLNSFSAPVDNQLKKPSSFTTSLATHNTIQKIKVITENKQLKSRIEKHLASYRGQVISSALKNTIRQKVFSLLQKKRFFWPNLNGPIFFSTPQGVIVSIFINHPYRYGWILKGNQHIPSDQLITKKIKNQIFNHRKSEQKLIELIKTAYLKKGYFRVRIQSRTQTDSNRFVKTFRLFITEGPILKIKTIQITGRFSRPTHYYMRLIKKFNRVLIRNNFFYKNTWDKGVTSLKNQLKKEGYLQANLYSKIKKEKNQVTININLNEGPLTQINQMTFKGNHHFSDHQLQELIQTKPQLGWNPYLLDQDVHTLIKAYKEQGFMEMTINTNNMISYNPSTAKVDLLFDIKENQKIIVSDIIIQGAGITKSHFIKKTLPLKINDILTSKKINYSIKKLRKLGIFSSVDILVVNTKKKQSRKRIVIVKVKERKPRLIRIGAGLNTERVLTARGFLQLSHHNLWGVGRGVFSNIKLQSNMARLFDMISPTLPHIEHQADLIYTEPFLLHSPFSGQVSLSHANTISLYNKDQNSLNIANTAKLNFNLQKEINPHINWQLTLLSWEGKKEFEKSSRCLNRNVGLQSLPPQLKGICEDRTLNMTGTGLAINIDKRNQVISTSEGFLSKWFVEHTGPYFPNSSEEINFIKMEMKHFDFHSLFDQLVWVNSLQGGMIFNLNKSLNNSGFPVSRSFILGGVNSLRGFDGLLDGQRVPDKEEMDISGANQIIMASSSVFFLIKTELRFPINNQLKGSVFYDGGGVMISGMDFKQPYRHSAGFGLRYRTPLGSISGYLAFKITPKKNESPFLPHLSFGSF